MGSIGEISCIHGLRRSAPFLLDRTAAIHCSVDQATRGGGAGCIARGWRRRRGQAAGVEADAPTPTAAAVDWGSEVAHKRRSSGSGCLCSLSKVCDTFSYFNPFSVNLAAAWMK